MTAGIDTHIDGDCACGDCWPQLLAAAGGPVQISTDPVDWSCLAASGVFIWPDDGPAALNPSALDLSTPQERYDAHVLDAALAALEHDDPNVDLFVAQAAEMLERYGLGEADARAALGVAA